MKALGTLSQDFSLTFNEATKARLQEYFGDDWNTKGICSLVALLRDFGPLGNIDGFADAQEAGLDATSYLDDTGGDVWEIQE